MYNDTVSGLVDKHPLELPDAHGPIVHLQEKLFVPVKEYPDVSLTPHTHTQHTIPRRECDQTHTHTYTYYTSHPTDTHTSLSHTVP